MSRFPQNGHGVARPVSTRTSSARRFQAFLASPSAQKAARALGWGAVALFVVDRPARALPSPDVVVNLFASSAQVLGLLTVVLGKWFFAGRRKGVASAGSSTSYRSAFLACAVLLVGSLVGWGLSAAHQADLKMQRLQVNINRESYPFSARKVAISQLRLPLAQKR